MQDSSEYLSYRLHGAGTSPALVFLHGFLGSQHDWQPVIDELKQDYRCLTIDLPGHGASRDVRVTSFDDTCDWIIRTVLHALQQPFWLMGYSLGARLAMSLVANHAQTLALSASPIQGVIVESGHTGLPAEERPLRAMSDERWARRFESEPIVDVLQDWYQQAVFSSLNHEQKQCFVAARSDNLGENVASMLRATSLSKQENLIEPLQKSGIPVHYICGDKDEKFKAVAIRSGFAFHAIPNAGHNIHAEQPVLFCQLVKQLIDTD